MKFENIRVATDKGHTFKNPVPVRFYYNAKIGPQVGSIDLHVSEGNLMGNLEVDEDHVQGDFTFLLFLTGDSIMTVLLEPQNVQKPTPFSAN